MPYLQDFLLGPAVLGNLLSGVVIGGHHLENFGFTPDRILLNILSEIGVIVLMFCAGLETDINELKKMWKSIIYYCSVRCYLYHL